MEDIVKYEVSIRKVEKRLYFYSVTEGEKTVASGQAFGIGDAMMKASDSVFQYLENEGRVK